MLTPEQVAAYCDAARKITDPMTEYLLKDIAQRVARAGQLTSTAAYEIWVSQQLGTSQRQIKAELRKILKASHRKIRQLLTQAAEVGYDFDIKHLPQVQAVKFEDNGSIQQIVKAAVALAESDFTNLTQTIGMVDPYGQPLPLRDAYRACTDFAFKQVSTGAADYMTACRQATQKLANTGLLTIEYESGVKTSLEAAVRRNVMGGLGLMQEQISHQNHDDLGADGWEISAHACSAPDHEPIQGKQYSDVEYIRLNNSLCRRIGTLNCGHAAFPVILGVNSPQYSQNELAEIREDNEKGVWVDGTHYTGYEATQQQRAFERAIRKQKRQVIMDEALGDSDTLAVDQSKLAVLNQEYQRFSDKAGLRTETERLEIAVSQNYMAAGKANSILARSHKKYSDRMTMRTGCGKLTKEDIYALDQYKKSSVAYPLNSSLRGETPVSDSQRAIIHNIDQALLKLPTFQGAVYRSMMSEYMDDIGAFWERYKPGKIVIENAYTSASTEIYDESMDIQICITSKHGRDMRAYNSLENEILFRRGSMFFVDRREGNILWLTEI